MARSSAPTPTLSDSLRRWASSSFGTSGAVRNCRRELDDRRRSDRTVDELRSRLDGHATH